MLHFLNIYFAITIIIIISVILLQSPTSMSVSIYYSHLSLYKLVYFVGQIYLKSCRIWFDLYRSLEDSTYVCLITANNEIFLSLYL